MFVLEVERSHLSTQGLDLYDIANHIFGAPAQSNTLQSHKSQPRKFNNQLPSGSFESDLTDPDYEPNSEEKDQELYIESNSGFPEQHADESYQPSQSLSQSFGEEPSTTPTPQHLQKEISYHSSLSSIPVSELPSEIEQDHPHPQARADLSLPSFTFPPGMAHQRGSRGRDPSTQHHRQQPYVDTVSSMSQIKTVPNMPSSMSIDSPTPSRHPELSRGSSYYSSMKARNKPSQNRAPNVNQYHYDNDSNGSNEYAHTSTYPKYGNPSQGREERMAPNASNMAVYDDTRTRSSPQPRESSLQFHHPLPRIPIQPKIYKLSDYYDPEDDGELHQEIPIESDDDRDHEYYQNDESHSQLAPGGINTELKRYIDIMVEQLGKKFEESKLMPKTSPNSSSISKAASGIPETSSNLRKQAVDSLVQLTPIQNGNSFFVAQGGMSNAIPSPNWSEDDVAPPPLIRSQVHESKNDLSKTASQKETSPSAAKELLRLKRFLKDLPNGGQLLESFEHGINPVKKDRSVNDDNKSLFETPQGTQGLGIRDSHIVHRSASASAFQPPASRKESIIYQSTPLDTAKRRSVSSSQPRRSHSSFISQVSKPEGLPPRNTVSFASDPPRVISSAPPSAASIARSQARMSSDTLHSSSSATSSSADVDAGLIKLLSHLTEKDTKIEVLNGKLESTEKELQAAKKYITKLRGASKPIGPEAMPDAHKNGIPESRKLYKKLGMNSVDDLGIIDLQNLVKNILLVLGTPLPQLPHKLKSITSVLKQEDLYVQFANEMHYSLYSKQIDLQDPFSKDASACLSNMVALVRQLDAKRV